VTTWTNWNKNQRCKPAAVYEPGSTAEVVEIVRRAADAGHRVRVVGRGGSWSALVPTEEWLISSAKLDRCLAIDQERQQIRVGAGMTIGELVARAAASGLSVRSPTVYKLLSVGGVIATGSHGTGRDVATFGDGVVDFTLVTGSGEVLTARDLDADGLRAVQANLGGLGVITDVTLQCEPSFDLLTVDRPVPLHEAVFNLDRYVREHEFVELFWFPPGDDVVLKLADRTTQTPFEQLERGVLRDAASRLMSTKIWPRLAVPIGGRWPKLCSRMILGGWPIGSKTQPVSRAFHYHQYYGPMWDMEYAIPQSHARAALTWTIETILDQESRGRHPVDLVVHARFCGASQAWLAPSFGRPTCHLEVIATRENPAWLEYSHRFEDAMIERFAGRPHWGKVFHRTQHLARTYDESAGQYEQLRARLDPHKLFEHEYLSILRQTAPAQVNPRDASDGAGRFGVRLG
jgi:L-gulonolactone oxidase